MTKEHVEDWLNELKKYWLREDVEGAVSLFQKTKYYQESPFLEPYTNIEDIRNVWGPIKNAMVQELNFRLLSFDENIAIVNWILKQDNRNYDGIYEIHFDNHGNCIYFKSWEMTK